MMHTKIQKFKKKNIKTEESIISHSGSKQKNRNIAVLVKELDTITKYIKKATERKKTNWSKRALSTSI